MAPETITDPDKVRPVSDIYSLGCTLYYAVTGKVPFPGGNTAEKMQRHLNEMPLNPLHFNPDLPEAFCDVIAAMMDKNPDKRTPTAAAVVEAARAVVRSVGHAASGGTEPAAVRHFRSAALDPPADADRQPLLEETAEYVLDDFENNAFARSRARARFRKARCRSRPNRKTPTRTTVNRRRPRRPSPPRPRPQVLKPGSGSAPRSRC